MGSAGPRKIQCDEVDQLGQALRLGHVTGQRQVGQIGHAACLVQIQVRCFAKVTLAGAKGQPLKLGQLPQLVWLVWQAHVPAARHG